MWTCFEWELLLVSIMYLWNQQTLTADELESLNADVILMSPPCQPYTRVGNQKDVQDERAKSFLHILELLPKLVWFNKYFLNANLTLVSWFPRIRLQEPSHQYFLITKEHQFWKPFVTNETLVIAWSVCSFRYSSGRGCWCSGWVTQVIFVCEISTRSSWQQCLVTEDWLCNITKGFAENSWELWDMLIIFKHSLRFNKEGLLLYQWCWWLAAVKTVH